MVTSSVNVLGPPPGGSHTHTSAPPPMSAALTRAAFTVDTGAACVPGLPGAPSGASATNVPLQVSAPDTHAVWVTQPPSAGPHATPPPGLPLSTAPSQSLSRRSQASATGPVSPVQPPHTPPVQVWVPATHSPMSLPHARISPPEHGGSASAGAPSVGAPSPSPSIRAPSVGAPSIRAPSVAPSLVAPSGAGLASDPSPVSLSPHAARTPRPSKNTTAERVKDATRIDPSAASQVIPS